eukprot:CAMPEP_0204619114 /NCGR_PEP_ID=MMETSP0717-20131115/5570_1 /ASSEMBLY_ACC=CAM_ASM_000666 /TAXON_ID=230516 /ORGANISM="Chaetoceros curvisetus" /LENGTH=46 /DNA_ID= /DNA_START= /DNA_END= /DNA_ORIENTATION=
MLEYHVAVAYHSKSSPYLKRDHCIGTWISQLCRASDDDDDDDDDRP